MKAVIVVFLLCVVLSCVSSQTCTYGDYNLTSLSIPNGMVPPQYQITDAEGYLYTINFCAPVVTGGCQNPTVSVNQQTGLAYTIVPAVCQDLDGVAWHAIGDLNSAVWSSLVYPVTLPVTNVTYTEGVVLEYSNGEWCKATATARVTTIYVLCDQSEEGRITYVEEPPGTQCVYNIYFNSKYGCASPAQPENSAGILIAWIFVALSLAVVVGCLFILIVLGVFSVFRKRNTYSTIH